MGQLRTLERVTQFLMALSLFIELQHSPSKQNVWHRCAFQPKKM